MGFQGTPKITGKEFQNIYIYSLHFNHKHSKYHTNRKSLQSYFSLKKDNQNFHHHFV